MSSVITIDGPAGVGKTSLARLLAHKLGWAYLDTGAMFRALAFKLGADVESLSYHDLEARCASLHFSLEGVGKDTCLFCNGEPVGSEIRTEAVGLLAARIGCIPQVRSVLVQKQRELARVVSLVAEGRDMGTVVFPEAICKFFLEASAEIRARRRLNDKARQDQADLATLIKQISERDELDRNRPIAPLKPAKDAQIIDTSSLALEEVLGKMLAVLAAKGLG